jgi:serine phosphatase RsbU (regulator of sigma subunit)
MAREANPVGRRRRRRSDVALNRARIVEAARHLLADDPDATMSEIAAKAGVARGTAYRHFPTRDALIDAVRRQERDDAEANQLEFIRPAGEVAHHAPTPLSITEVLNKVPPFQLGEQIVAEAQRLAGVTAAAIYLCDLDGTTMQRMAGRGGFPDRLAVPLAVGPEIPRDGVEALRAKIDEVLPGVVVAPMYLRGRAMGVLVAIGAADDALRDLAAEAAAALALADEYTDAISAVRRVRPTSPAAEIQQNLLPPRILRIAGAMVAGNVLPGYDIGGDWFDYAENPEGAWIGIADSEGTGPRAASLGAVTLGAFRATRRGCTDPAGIIRAMHAVLEELGERRALVTATIGLWNAPASRFSWVSCGEQHPVSVNADGRIAVLDEFSLPALGHRRFPDQIVVQTCRLAPGDRLLLLSDGVLERPTGSGGGLGLEGVSTAMGKAPDASAPATLRAIEDAVRDATPEALSDDATLVVLAASGLAGVQS